MKARPEPLVFQLSTHTFPSARESALYLTTNTDCTSLQKATFEKKTPFCGFISCRTKFSQIFFEDLFPSKKSAKRNVLRTGSPLQRGTADNRSLLSR
ncbi:hypothetical protein [uncultured Mailhella sp.]|uniref:hypothetical protein n=1 Tax=uncultured Mailhella sp. TaxID=1981031 RepID=UPI0026339CE1|nr:hypothetical protein [uncultured Mailhella sp.]